MLWIKSFHVIFMVTWFAGLFYLPRIFVYHAQNPPQEVQTLFKTMERRLFIMMTLGGLLTAVFGFWLLFGYWMTSMGSQGWLHAKLFLVALLIGYHFFCWKLMLDFRNDRNTRSHRWYRWFNEAPTLVLVIVVILVIVKPF